MGAVLAAVLRPREAQCPLVRCIVRELLTCLVMEPVMRFASPGHINELIEGIFLANNNKDGNEAGDDQSTNVTGQNQNLEKSQDLASMKSDSSSSQKNNTPNDQNGIGLSPLVPMVSEPVQDELLLNPQSIAWARALEAATQRRTEVLQPENLENMWTKGRNYKKKIQKQIESSRINKYSRILSDQSKKSDPSDLSDGSKSNVVIKGKTNMESSNSVSDQNQVGGPIISEFYSANGGVDNDVHNVNNNGPDKGTRIEGYVPKLRCRVLGACFENLDSKSFAVYSIGVTDVDNKTCTEDAIVLKRCIQLDKYLQDLLSIANIAEQHEVWDFLSMSSKVYELLFWKVIIGGENLSRYVAYS
ncbi:hypothetical protein M8C21_017078 [Ambrosia artemisiifolia]|uniref:PXA domain-containing protein n=1 Tax=Ambrosia artemisiifolia TaxID=4212 RepID=A0AAD5DD60_AMBAR|nr:hypothetical protein M8C21_017078 [Ambrosia artemisiifolia]